MLVTTTVKPVNNQPINVLPVKMMKIDYKLLLAHVRQDFMM